jgi:hypothetical protein
MLVYTDEKQWERIRALGAAEGATSEQMRKWRERGVPAKWQLLFITKSKGKLSVRDFEPQQRASAA